MKRKMTAVCRYFGTRAYKIFEDGHPETPTCKHRWQRARGTAALLDAYGSGRQRVMRRKEKWRLLGVAVGWGEILQFRSGWI